MWYGPEALWWSFGFCGCWFDLQWWRSWYALVMRPNKVEASVQCSVCHMLAGFSSHGNSINIYISSPTVVKGDTKAPFSSATTLTYWRGRYSFPRIAQLTLDPYLIMLSVKQGGIKYHFWVFAWLDMGLNPGLSEHRRTLTIMPMIW